MSSWTFAEWYAPRARVVKWIAAGYSSFAVALLVTWSTAPRIAPLAAPVDRLLLAVQLAALPSFVVVAILQTLWRMQDTVEAEAQPLAGLESDRWKINQRVMTNTIEQWVIFVPTFLALAVRMEPSQTYWLPFLMALWCAGRLMFWIGYNIEPVYRAIGMDWTTGVALTTAILLGTTLF